MELVYFIISILLAVFFFRELGRYDGPKIPDRTQNDIALGPRSIFEREVTMNAFFMRRMLSGSWFRAIWMFGLWLAIPVFLLSSGSVPDAAAIVFALPGGFALAVASYNVRKRIRGR